MNRRARVLVVDDGEGLLSTALRDALVEHEVHVAHDAIEAIYRLDGEGGPFDLIFCDLARGDLPGPELWAYLSLHRANDARRIVFVASGPLLPETQIFLERVPNVCVELPLDSEALHMLAVRRASPPPGSLSRVELGGHHR